MQIGSKVRLTQNVENYPVILAKSGLTGILVRIDDEGSYWVKLDERKEELDDWNNELQIWNYSEQDGPSAHPTAFIEEITP